MILDYTCTLASYNVWANSRIVEFILIAGEEKANIVQESSFSTIRKTVLHIWDAETIWLQRLKGKSLDTWPSKSFKVSFEGVCKGMLLTSDEFKKFATQLTITDLDRKISYSNLNGDPFTNTFFEVITHVFNHSTFHRGQLVTMLRAAGSTNLAPTDLIAYYREQSQ